MAISTSGLPCATTMSKSPMAGAKPISRTSRSARAALVIARWSYGLLRETSAVLLDGAVPVETTEKLRAALEDGTDDLVSDLHVWHVGPGRLAALVVIVSDEPRPTEHYRTLLGSVTELAHVTVEVVRCPDHGLEAA
jgi:Co/Zn/Cd efflux system component